MGKKDERKKERKKERRNGVSGTRVVPGDGFSVKMTVCRAKNIAPRGVRVTFTGTSIANTQ